MLLISNSVTSRNSRTSWLSGRRMRCVPLRQWPPMQVTPLYSRMSPVLSFHTRRSQGYPASRSTMASLICITPLVVGFIECLVKQFRRANGIGPVWIKSAASPGEGEVGNIIVGTAVLNINGCDGDLLGSV